MEFESVFVFREEEIKKRETGVRTVARFVCFNKLADFHDTEGYLDCVCLNSCVDGGLEMAAVCMFETKTEVLVVAPCSLLIYCATHKYIVKFLFLTEIDEI